MADSKWDNRFMDMAKLVASWSKDPGAKVGAVITKDSRVLSTGFNGFPRGVLDAIASRADKLRRTIHAETNAILFSKQDLNGTTLYCTHHPCAQCAALIIQAGISRVMCPSIDDTDISDEWRVDFYIAMDLFIQARVKVDFVGNK